MAKVTIIKQKIEEIVIEDYNRNCKLRIRQDIGVNFLHAYVDSKPGSLENAYWSIPLDDIEPICEALKALAEQQRTKLNYGSF